MVKIKEQLKLNLPARVKRQLKDIAEDKKLSMNDIVLHAINDHIAKQNATYQNPDLFTDKLSQVLNACMAQATAINNNTVAVEQSAALIEELRQEIDELKLLIKSRR